MTTPSTTPQVDTQEPEFVLYCGQQVILEDIEYTAHGNVACISFEDGREDQVPLSTIEFLK